MSIALAWLSGAAAMAAAWVFLVVESRPWMLGCGFGSVVLLVLAVLARIAPAF